MPKKGVLRKLNPKSKGKVQKSKAQRSMPLVATAEMLAEREYTYEQNMVVHTLDQGIDRNMIKTEEIKLEAEAVEGEEINQFLTNSVHITSDKLIKNEPESFLETEALSTPTHDKTTASIPVRKKRKNVAIKRRKLAKEELKIAAEQEKRQAKRARNPDRHKENIAQLPDYSELSQCHNQV
ncbi:hypothetical protein Ddc_04751 [Ditylenchus destructor]|nr:hypothetical protein Ddc_04751 [Ditylenchus destructor]